MNLMNHLSTLRNEKRCASVDLYISLLDMLFGVYVYAVQTGLLALIHEGVIVVMMSWRHI